MRSPSQNECPLPMTRRTGGLRWIVVAGLCGLAAAATAQQPSPGNSLYEQHLHEGYTRSAATQRAEGDHVDMRLFELKAAKAARGAVVDPEDPASRRLPATVQDEARTAHERLGRALNTGVFLQKPVDTATAQVMYDCWIEALEDGSQPQLAAQCRAAFSAAMARIEDTQPPSRTWRQVSAPATTVTHSAYRQPAGAPQTVQGMRAPACDRRPAMPASTRPMMAYRFAPPLSATDRCYRSAALRGMPPPHSPRPALPADYAPPPRPGLDKSGYYHIQNCSGHCWDGEYILPKAEQRMFPLPTPWLR